MRIWYTMTVAEAEADDDEKKSTSAEIVIYDAIGKSFWDDDAVSAKDFIDSLTMLGDVAHITMRINSPGGDVFDGVAIHNAIKNHKAKVTAQIDGIAASAASFIAMAADKIIMPSNAFMLVHQSSGFSFGNADDMRAVAADLDRIDKSITATYVARTGQTAAKVKALMKEDRLMDAAEAKSLGYTDEVTSPVKVSAKFGARFLNLMPQAAADRIRAETGDGQGDPPLPAPEPQEPEALPEAQPAPTIAEPAPAPAQVQEPSAESVRAYVAAVTDLCMLAAVPERLGAYLKANTPVDQVRKELLAARATKADVVSQHPLAAHSVSNPPANAWAKITDKLNAKRAQK